MTPAPISVERLRELLDNYPSIPTYNPYDQAVVNELLEPLPALLQQLAELQAKTACALGVGDGSGQLFVHGDYESIKAAQGIIDKLAEMEAEVARLERDRDALGAKLVEECDLRIAVEASWHHELARAEAAERARGEAERDLRAIYEAVPGLPIYATEEDADRATDAFTAICHLCNEYIASGAASGGSNG